MWVGEEKFAKKYIFLPHIIEQGGKTNQCIYNTFVPSWDVLLPDYAGLYVGIVKRQYNLLPFPDH